MKSASYKMKKEEVDEHMDALTAVQMIYPRNLKQKLQPYLNQQ